MDTYYLVFLSAATAQSAVLELLRRSQWFTVEPEPDDKYKITVKEENKDMLTALRWPRGTMSFIDQPFSPDPALFSFMDVPGGTFVARKVQEAKELVESISSVSSGLGIDLAIACAWEQSERQGTDGQDVLKHMQYIHKQLGLFINNLARLPKRPEYRTQQCKRCGQIILLKADQNPNIDNGGPGRHDWGEPRPLPPGTTLHPDQMMTNHLCPKNR